MPQVQVADVLRDPAVTLVRVVHGCTRLRPRPILPDIPRSNII